MSVRTLRIQVLVCGFVFVAATRSVRAASFQVTGVTPRAAYPCPSASGCTTAVTVQGQGFNAALTGCIITCIGPSVLFGGQPGIITSITDTEVTVLLPVHSPGTVDLTVVSVFPGDTSTLPAGFTFLDPASIPLLAPRAAALLALALAGIGCIVSARM